MKSIIIDGVEYELTPKEKQSKPDWEVVEIKSSEGYIIDRKDNIDILLGSDSAKHSKIKWQINSVRRLSDGCVFSVGDNFKWDWQSAPGMQYFTIKEFKLNPPDDIYFVPTQGNDLSFKNMKNLQKITTPSSKPQDNKILFTTEEVNNIEEKAFQAARCGIVTKWWKPGQPFSTNNISPVNTIEEYRNHPEYKKYLERPHPNKLT